MSYPIKVESFVAGNAAEIIQVDSGVVSIGRESDNNVIVDSSSVSRHHGCLIEAGSQWVYCDLNSSNGSYVNGVQLAAGNIRLVRAGDILHIADYPLRLTAEHSEPADQDDMPTTLLIFVNNRFELEFPLVHPGAQFRLGGNEADLPLADYGDDSPAIEITAAQSRLEVHTSRSAPPAIVAGMASAGVTALTDRDEIEISNIRIIVNDRRFVPPADQLKARQTSIIHGSAAEGRFSGSGGRPSGPPLAGAIRVGREQGAGWESEMTRKQGQAGRKFIFGAGEEGATPHEGSIARNFDSPSKSPYDVSPAQRFSGVMQAQSSDESSNSGDKMIIIVGGLVFLLVIVLVIFMLSLL